VEYEDEQVDRITIQIKGGIRETSGTFHIGDTVTLLVEAEVTSIEYKVNKRSGHLTRHHTLTYDKAETVRKSR
jgi:hypothetical protein